MNLEHLDHLQATVAQAESIVIIVSPKKFDFVAAAASLALGLQSLGKRVIFLTSAELEGDFTTITGLDQIQSELGNRNLQISFPYDPQAVNKVSYHIDEELNKFFLVVQPEKNHQPLDASQISFSYAGAEADLIFLVGVNSFEELDTLYYGYEEFYQQTQTVALHNYQPSVGTFKFDSATTDSLSGLVYLLLKKFEAGVTADIATNLLAGVEDFSDGFQSLGTSPYSFESAAELIRLGARRVRRRSKATTESQFVTTGEIIAGKDTPVKLTTANNSFAEAMSKKSHPLPKTSSKKEPKLDKSPAKPGGLDYQPGAGGVSGK